MVDLFSAPHNPVDILASLDPEQYAAATAGDGSVLVRAGAGTGKTRTLVARIVHLIRDRKVAPWNITAVTFTKKAAKEIRERVAAVLGDSVASSINMGTFHSLSARILRRHAQAAGLTPRFIVAPEEDARKMMEFAVERCGIVPKGDDIEEYRRVLAVRAEQAFSYVQSWKSWGLSPRMVADPKRKKRSEEEEMFARVYLAYQADMRFDDRVDFGDLIVSVIDLFELDESIAAAESDRIHHLLVDEAQDANPSQVIWARWMSHRCRNIFAVGDEDQSIFSFQGGYPGALLDLTGQGALHLGLTRNRRCTDEILAPAVALVGWNRRAAPKALQSGVGGDPVSFRVAGSDREEATAIASSIKSEMKSGTAISDIAVLVRSGWVMKPLEEALIKAGIPYEIVGGLSLMKRREVLVLHSYLRLADNPMDRLAFARIHAEPTRGVGQAAAEALRGMVERRHIPFYQACMELDVLEGAKIDKGMRDGLEKLGWQLEMLHMRREVGTTKTVDLLSMVLEDGDGYGIGYRRFIASSKGPKPRLENLKIIERIAADFPDLNDFFDELSLGQDDDVVDPDKLRISTMHSSKGLEWDVVYCPALEMDVTPNRRAVAETRSGRVGDHWNGPSGGGMDEERRLVHVAFTRARKRLHISCSLSRGGKSSTPSPFLPESGIDPMLASNEADRLPVKRARPSKAEPRSGRKGFSSMRSAYD